MALVMQAQRFGPSPWRWAALAALVPLPWLGSALHQSRNDNQSGVGSGDSGGQRAGQLAEKERKAFQDAFLKRIHEETNKAYNVFLNEGGVLDLAPGGTKARKTWTASRGISPSRRNSA